MNAISYILNKNKEKENPYLPQQNDEQPSAAGGVTDGVDSTNPSDAVPPKAAVRYPDKPERFSDDEYEYLLKFQSPEQIAGGQAYKPGSNYLENYYTSTTTKPRQFDEKLHQKKMMFAGIGDSVGLLAKMWAASKGAHVKESDSSVMLNVARQAEQLRELYRKEEERYNQGLYGARLKDLTMSLQQSAQDRKEALSLLQNKQKAEADAQKSAALQQHREQQNTLARDKFEQQKEYQKATLEERKRNNKVSEGIRAANAQRRASGSSSSKDNFLYIPAREGDKDVVDVAGVSMSRYPATKEQIDDLASRAKLDKDFVNSDYYKQAIRNQVDEEEGSASPYALPGQKGSTSKPRYANNRQLAAYYVQYLREQQQFSGLETMPMHPPGMENGESNTTTKKIGW